jgi:hemerythrin-like metal-binding protein
VLAMYVNSHFKLEEEYINKYNYPDKEEHFKEHKNYIKELKEFRSKYTRYSKKASDKLVSRLGEWILSHIMERDQKLGKYILEFEKKNLK